MSESEVDGEDVILFVDDDFPLDFCNGVLCFKVEGVFSNEGKIREVFWIC